MQDISGYTIKNRVGEDNLSLLFSAVDDNNKNFLIRELRQEHSLLADITLLQSNIVLYKNISHPCILKNINVSSANGSAVLVSDYFKGITLHEYMKNSTFTVKGFLDSAVQMVEALHHIHIHDLVHRFINPLNIFINPDTMKTMISDFSLFTEFDFESKRFFNASTFANIIPYISPEQSGTLKRTVDYRSDFYSLGMVLYEMITGTKLCFLDESGDNMSPCVIQDPAPPHQLNSSVPEAVSAIMLKLIRTEPEDRYYNHIAIINDLNICRNQLRDKGKISGFHISSNDIPEKFHVSQKLYGRETDRAEIQGTFQQVTRGKHELMLVSGPSGIGKSYLVLDTINRLIGTRGTFITGKCDQLYRDLPYRPIIQAFKSLIRQILNESPEGREIWRDSILEAVGPGGRIITEVIPELEQIIGEQPLAPRLDHEKARNRFISVFTKFIQVFISDNHPLVLFIDDLQWIDSASLILIRYMTTSPELGSLILVGAYRDNEVSEYHGLTIMKNELINSGITIREISLSPLSRRDVEDLIRDTFRTQEGSSGKLAAATHKYTQGNPLLINQLLKSLHERELISLTPGAGWNWDIDAIQKLYESDDIIMLMVNKISMLHPESREILKVSSCIGETFSLEILKDVIGLPVDSTISCIRELITDGYLMNADSGFRFSHDRIYEAAHSLLTTDERLHLHKKIGETFLHHSGNSYINEQIFTIVNHLNLASELHSEKDDSYRLARFNLQAGMRAKMSVAYDSADGYFKKGMELLPPDSWREEYKLAMDLHRERFESSYLTDRLEDAYSIYVEIMTHSRTRLERAYIHYINVSLLMNAGRPKMATAVGIAGLKVLDIRIRENPSEFRLTYNMFILKLRIKFFRENLASLIDLPDMTDEEKLMAMTLLMNLWMPGYASNHIFMKLIGIEMIKIILKSGISDSASFGFSSIGMLIGQGMGDYVDGYIFGELSLKVLKRFKNPLLYCKINFLFGAHHNHWRKHARSNIPYLLDAHKNGLENGDVYYTGVSGVFHTGTLAMIGEPLGSVCNTALKYIEYTQKSKNIHLKNAIMVMLMTSRNLMGLTASRESLDTDDFNEEWFISQLKSSEVIQPFQWYCMFKARCLFVFGYMEEALRIIKLDDEIIDWHFSSLMFPEHYFLYSLILTRLYDTATVIEKKIFLKRIKKHQKMMKTWAENCPDNFLHKYLLIEAELRRIMGRDMEAINRYNEAIRSAEKYGYIQNQAIACELAAEFYLSRNLLEIAGQYILSSIRHYSAWGADAKVEQMRERHSEIIRNCAGPDEFPHTWQEPEAEETPDYSKNLERITELLESSDETGLTPEFMGEILLNITEYTRANRGFIIFKKDNALHNAYGVESGNILDTDPESSSVISTGGNSDDIIRSVIDTGKFYTGRIIEKEESYESAPSESSGYLACIPLIDAAEVSGCIYLEKKAETGGFVDERMFSSRIICMQLASALSGPKKKAGDDRKGRMSRSLLRGLDTGRIHNMLMDTMENKKVFAVEDLSLSMLADDLSITPQQLSEFLNDKLGVNFNTFVNRYRIDEAKRLLVEKPDRSVTTIAYDVGFNSTSVFYYAFLKFTNISPVKYRKEHIRQD